MSPKGRQKVSTSYTKIAKLEAKLTSFQKELTALQKQDKHVIKLTT